MIDPELIRKINTGRCFVLVGSGPSCEMGYPSWEVLCLKVYEFLKTRANNIDELSYNKFLEKKQYPEMLRQAEIDLGGRDHLIKLLKSLLIATGGADIIYTLLSKWPFACYFTTNYDDEISVHLTRQKTYFKVLKNSKEDLSLIRDGASNLIVKIHSDLDDPNNVVITSTDYSSLMYGSSRSHIREKLVTVFQMFDVLIIGHSVTDPDLQMILEVAKQAASPTHPIYFITTGLTKGEVREFYERKNIRTVLYENHSRNHLQLKNLLSTIDKFVLHRVKHPSVQEKPIDEEEVATASSIFIYRRLFGFASEAPDVWTSLVKSLVLRSLTGVDKTGIEISSLIIRSPLSTLTQSNSSDVEKVVTVAINELHKDNLVDVSGSNISITQLGTTQVQDIEKTRKLEEDLAFGQFRLDISKKASSIPSEKLDELVTILRKLLIDAFKRRGLTITQALLSSNSVGLEDMPEMFRLITDAASQIAETTHRLVFIDSAHDFLIRPTEQQKEYLLSLSQGYFTYHMIGLDPTCSKFRIEQFRQTAWFFDASVLLPLVATGSYNHEYAVDLFSRLSNLGIIVFTTDKFLSEVSLHLDWAVNFMKGKRIDSLPVLEASTSQAEYRQNLFIDGCIRQVALANVMDFEEYLHTLFPRGTQPKELQKLLGSKGIRVISVSDLEGFELARWGDINELESRITDYRVKRGTYRGSEQVSAEAEMLLIIRALRSGGVKIKDLMVSFEKAYFVSQSHVLDRVDNDLIITWSPESIYRYLTSMPGQIADKELLQQCMLQDFFYVGIRFIDQERYLRTFGSIITQAKLEFQKEKERYIQATEHKYAASIDSDFEKVDDLQKPFFVAQMKWELAEKAERQAVEARTEAEKSIEMEKQKVEAEKADLRRRNLERERQVQATIRQFQSSKHRKKKAKQAKKRARKKKK